MTLEEQIDSLEKRFMNFGLRLGNLESKLENLDHHFVKLGPLNMVQHRD